MKLRLYMGYEQTMISQNFQTLAKVVSAAFGGESSGKKTSNLKPVQNEQELAAKFGKMFG